MKKIVKNNLIKLPRKIRIYFGKIFMYMLGTVGTHEFEDDIILYNELKKWVDSGGKPTTPYLKKQLCVECNTKLEHHNNVGMWCNKCKGYE